MLSEADVKLAILSAANVKLLLCPCILRPQFYITFWSLSMYDLYVPTAAYDKQRQVQQNQINAIEDNRDMVGFHLFILFFCLLFIFLQFKWTKLFYIHADYGDVYNMLLVWLRPSVQCCFLMPCLPQHNLFADCYF